LDFSSGGSEQFSELTRENSFRTDIPKEDIVNPFYFWIRSAIIFLLGSRNTKDKINEFRPRMESLVTRK